MVERRLQEIASRKAEIRGLLESDEKVDLEALEAELKALNDEEQELRRRLDVARQINDGIVAARVVASTGRETAEARTLDRYDTLEYRKAFMDYVLKGVRSNVLDFQPIEQRADQVTLPADIGAVIPTTILNRIVERMQETGRIWSRVT